MVYVWWLLFNWWRCRNKVISAGDLVLFFLIGNFTVVHFIFEWKSLLLDIFFFLYNHRTFYDSSFPHTSGFGYWIKIVDKNLLLSPLRTKFNDYPFDRREDLKAMLPAARREAIRNGILEPLNVSFLFGRDSSPAGVISSRPSSSSSSASTSSFSFSSFARCIIRAKTLIYDCVP